MTIYSINKFFQCIALLCIINTHLCLADVENEKNSFYDDLSTLDYETKVALVKQALASKNLLDSNLVQEWKHRELSIEQKITNMKIITPSSSENNVDRSHTRRLNGKKGGEQAKGYHNFNNNYNRNYNANFNTYQQQPQQIPEGKGKKDASQAAYYGGGGGEGGGKKGVLGYGQQQQQMYSNNNNYYYPQQQNYIPNKNVAGYQNGYNYRPQTYENSYYGQGGSTVVMRGQQSPQNKNYGPSVPFNSDNSQEGSGGDSTSNKNYATYKYNKGNCPENGSQGVPCAPDNLEQICNKYDRVNGSFKACYEQCQPSFCCNHDAKNNELASPCQSDENCAQYQPCYIVWWRMHDTIGPAIYILIEQDDDFFDMTNEDIEGDKTGDPFWNQVILHHFDDIAEIIAYEEAVNGEFNTKNVFDNPDYWIDGKPDDLTQ